MEELLKRLEQEYDDHVQVVLGYDQALENDHLSTDNFVEYSQKKREFCIRALEVKNIMDLIREEYTVPDSSTSLTMTHPGMKVNYEIK